MTWRGLASVPDRIFSSLAYLLPLFYVMPFGSSLFAMFPPLQVLYLAVLPIAVVYSIPFASLIVFMVLYLLVVRNSRISMFIRYNTMQALLMGIAIFLIQLVQMLLGRIDPLQFLMQVLSNFVFIGVLAAVIFAVIQCIRGIFPELPTLSDATKSQVF
ncbi:hypothetical protein L3556_14230 [Candidatus Synechococcus calcipolaris G9]|uniref:Tic20 family protein Ycf60 n=1 Tax=Candidatus Synechococcus calcipolaris G9 TaxID=1497997 RepID=A0ABT6F2I9_9SYNE|nr:Tic20 family protein [Candidatus Synechococcus calcipolaris]MDG2992079.1 hypothetical protein [Candidatus Synechococcus calcipolaris G9]